MLLATNMSNSVIPTAVYIHGVSEKFGEWYQEKKEKRKYKQINYIAL
jgi:hypothetical protein